MEPSALELGGITPEAPPGEEDRSSSTAAQVISNPVERRPAADIEHRVVHDDPRKWSKSRKVV